MKIMIPVVKSSRTDVNTPGRRSPKSKVKFDIPTGEI